MIELAQARQDADLERLPALGYTYDHAAADKVRVFFEEYLHHYKGVWAGQSLTLEDWQFDDILAPVFGWVRADGTRRFREAYVEVPRKNGKTLMGAGVGLYLFLADGEPGAEVYCAATKEKQAKILWNDASQMVSLSPHLNKMVGPHRRSNLYRESTASRFDFLGSDSTTQDGLNASGILLDELHAHKDSRIYSVLSSSCGARRQPLTFIITTAGLYDTESIGWQKHKHAENVLTGRVEDEAFFAYIACAAKDADPFSEDTWKAANPNYGVSLYPAFLEDEANKAKQQPSLYNAFLRYHLNIWTQAVTRWIDAEAWKNCGGATEEPDPLRPCWGALDIGNTQDTTAFALVWPPEDEDGDWILKVWFWCPEEPAAERTQGDQQMYTNWSDGGYITMTPGNTIDYSTIRAAIVALSEQYAVQEVWFDPWSATQFAQELADDHGFVTLPCPQGFARLNEPSSQFERLVYAGKLRHGDQPVLTWQSSHVTIRTNSQGAIMPDKSRKREKIDGIAAAVMAVGAAHTAERSIAGIYDDDDPLVIEL